jgi:hypothetical protein
MGDEEEWWTSDSHPECNQVIGDFGRNMPKYFLWILILVLIGFQSGCGLEKYHQIAAHNPGTKYSQVESRSGPQFGPSPG